MITPFQIYLWGIADQLRDSLILICVITAVPTIIFGIFAAYWGDKGAGDDIEQCKKWTSKCLTCSFVFAFMLTSRSILPSSKTIAMMFVIPAIANSHPIQKDLPDLYNMAVDALKSELKPTK